MTLVAWAAEVAHEAESTAGGIAAIGLDVKALLFQILNFAILLWLLKRFAYKPIVQLLEARRQKIEESLKTADAIAAEKVALEAERSRRLTEAEAEASRILARSKQEGLALVQAAEARSQKRAEEIESQAATRLQQQARQLRTSLKAETLQLVRRATERVLRQKLDSEADARLIEETIKES